MFIMCCTCPRNAVILSLPMGFLVMLHSKYEHKQALHAEAETLLVWNDVFTFSVSSITLSINIQNVSCPITGQNTKYSVSLVNWDFKGIQGMQVARSGYLSIEGRQLGNYYLCKTFITYITVNCVSSKCSNGRRIWDRYFHWYLVP